MRKSRSEPARKSSARLASGRGTPVMLVSQDDFVKIGRDGNFVVFEVVQPSSATTQSVKQPAEDFPQRHRDRLGWLFVQGTIGLSIHIGAEVDPKLRVYHEAVLHFAAERSLFTRP